MRAGFDPDQRPTPRAGFPLLERMFRNSPGEVGDDQRSANTRDDDFQRGRSSEGLGLEQDVLLVQQRRQPSGIPTQPACLLRQVRTHARADGSGQGARRAGHDRGRRQRLLPGEACRHFRAQCPGHRRAADRHDGRSLQGEAAGSGERRSSAALQRRTSLRSVARSPRACSRIRTGGRSSTVSNRRTHGLPPIARMRW
jgi:hypothetical protein